MPPGSDILRRVDVRVFFVSTGPTVEHCLAWPVVRAGVPAGGTFLAGVMCGHLHQPAPFPLQLVVELPHELTPALIQYGSVQPGLGPDVPAGLVEGACRRPAHVPHFQILDEDHRLVLADGRRDLVQEILPAAGDLVVKPLDAAFLPLPVLRRLHLAVQGSLRPSQLVLILAIGADRIVGDAVGQRGEVRHPQINAHVRGGRMHRLWQFLLHLHRHIPVPSPPRHRGVFYLTLDLAALEETDPTDLGQVDTPIIQFHTLWVAKGCVLVLALFAR